MDLKNIRSDYKNVRGIEQDVDVVAFNIAANGSLAKFDLVDQAVDAYEDDSAVNAAGSTNEVRSSGGKYYKGAVAGNATGGTITSYSSGGVTYKVHTFNSTANFVAPATGTVDYLVVGGGGAGRTGGGGAGGLVYASSYSLPAATYSAAIGAGGTSHGDGADTTFNSHTGSGGGGGGYYGPNSPGGATGGSGGGGGTGNSLGSRGGTSDQNAYSGTPNVTGYGSDNSAYWGGGYAAPTDEGSQGGGGAGGAGIFTRPWKAAKSSSRKRSCSSLEVERFKRLITASSVWLSVAARRIIYRLSNGILAVSLIASDCLTSLVTSGSIPYQIIRGRL